MIYLDNAATTFPKPESVLAALTDAQISCAGNPGRGSHSLSIAASEKIYELREALAHFFGLQYPENVVLTFNATYALNIAINALWRDGHILLSNLEHNSVVRPIAERKCSFSFFNALSGDIISELKRKVHRNTSMLVCTHMSNIISAELPVKEISHFCAKRGIRMILDCSQSAGCVPIGFGTVSADAICVPSHKSLYGIQGLGTVLFSERYANSIHSLKPLVFGGSGIASKSRAMPDYLPERLEAGTLSVPLAASWTAGIKEVEKIGIDIISERSASLRRYTEKQLSEIPGVNVYHPDSQVGSIALFNVKDIPSERVCSYLDSRGICVRGGLHCAPVAHNTLKTNGAVRASFGLFNTPEDADALCNAVSEISKRN